MKITTMQMGMSQSTPGDWGESKLPPKRFEDYEVYVTVEEEDEFMLIGGPVEKLLFFSNCPWTNSE
jgi:hypothetical protein